ncbi:hypothetical protein LC55x_4718 [Lysobacter capsici]|nr:hypothetical protein LC55x_4718 [Lysobacter capsici]
MRRSRPAARRGGLGNPVRVRASARTVRTHGERASMPGSFARRAR